MRTSDDTHPRQGVENAVAVPLLSIVIPALNEAATIGLLLEDLRSLGVTHEVIVADGGSGDDTAGIAERDGALVHRTPRGRGVQLSEGARHARAATLCFLHADVRLPEPAKRELERIASAPVERPAVFRLRIDARGLVYRLIELLANHVRTRLLRLPYGDQGLIVSRSAYDAVGGYRELPLMEDVEIVRALRHARGLTVLRTSLLTSARRWQDDGPWRRTFRNWALMIAYSLGASPQRLARLYSRPRPGSATDRRAATRR